MAFVGTHRALLTRPQQSLASLLFGNGENGFLFYPATDLTRIYLTSVGQTAVAANNDPVGLWLDNHSWQGRTLAQLLLVQPEKVTNGDFSQGTTGWTGNSISVTNGQLTGVSSAVSNVCASQAVSVTVGKSYYVAWDIVSVNVGTGSLVGLGGVVVPIAAGTGSHTAILTAISTGGLNFFGSGINTSITIDNVSVKEIPGNHALNATAGQRPLYKTNSPSPYLSFDGSDDRLVSPFIPTSNGTIAAAFYPTAVSGAAMGGGATTGDKRAILGVDTNGGFAYGLGDQTTFAGSTTSILNAPHVAVLTWQGLSGVAYLDAEFFASVSMNAGPDGTGGGIALGAYNNNGSAATFLTGRVSAAAATNDQLNASEVRQLTAAFQKTF